MDEPVWLTMAMLQAIHADLIREHGGSLGIRDSGMIESALARPQQKWSYAGEEADLASLAAAYGFGLAKNHGFVDGNKRVAFMSIYTFLLVNGLELEVDEPQVVAVMTALASGSLREDQLGAWIRTHCAPFEE